LRTIDKAVIRVGKRLVEPIEYQHVHVLGRVEGMGAERSGSKADTWKWVKRVGDRWVARPRSGPDVRAFEVGTGSAGGKTTAAEEGVVWDG
jgi:hypothetical protein